MVIFFKTKPCCNIEKYHKQTRSDTKRIIRQLHRKSINLRSVGISLLDYFDPPNLNLIKILYPLRFQIRCLQRLASKNNYFCFFHVFFINM